MARSTDINTITSMAAEDPAEFEDALTRVAFEEGLDWFTDDQLAVIAAQMTMRRQQADEKDRAIRATWTQQVAA